MQFLLLLKSTALIKIITQRDPQKLKLYSLPCTADDELVLWQYHHQLLLLLLQLIHLHPFASDYSAYGENKQWKLKLIWFLRIYTHSLFISELQQLVSSNRHKNRNKNNARLPTPLRTASLYPCGSIMRILPLEQQIPFISIEKENPVLYFNLPFSELSFLFI